ncbi:RcnB family protein [Allosphingosinicella humi]
MRKALMGLLMAATMATPLAAAPFDGGRPARGERVTEQGQRGVERNRARPARAERQQPRGDRRAEPGLNRGVEARRDNPAMRRAPTMRPSVRPDIRADRPAPTQRVERVERVRTGDQDRRGRTERPRESIYGGTPENVRHYQELERRNQERYGNDRRDDRRDWRNDRRDDRRDWRHDRRDDRRDWRSDRRDHRDWNRNWRNDRRYDWQRYRYSNRYLFRPGRYYAPYRGYSYSRFSIGLFLQPGFYASNYWISDPWQYRLPPAYPGTRWVRYYDDVLLVDLYTGEVIDVIYDFFW